MLRERGDTIKIKDDEFYVYFKGRRHCIFLKRTKGIKKAASDPRVEYHAIFVPFQYIFNNNIPLQHVENCRDKRLKKKKEEPLRILNPSIISVSQVDKIMHQMQAEMVDQVQRGINANEIEYIFRQWKKEYISQSLQLNYEPTFTDWLFQYTFTSLSSSDFIVESQKENLRDVGRNIYEEEINEYALSKADLVIRRNIVKEGSVSCCMVSPTNDDMDEGMARLQTDDKKKGGVR